MYDVTKFLEQHPGGEEVLLDLAGRDATTDFNDVGHSEEAHKLMKDYLIGKLDPNEVATPAPTKPKKSTSTSPSNQGTNYMAIIIPIILVVIAVLIYFR